MARVTVDIVRRQIYKFVGRHYDSQATDRELLQRFTRQRDEAAFETLFRRHAAMVLAAGRRILGNAHDAEDVCQATFLLLAKKASSQRWQASVANWLHKTAHLLALKARTATIRRARRERSAVLRPPTIPLAEVTGEQLLTALDEELLTLAEPLRAPLVLCYLQGATRDEAAQRLGCPLATLKNRLERGRAQLRAALVRRGLDLSAVLLSTVLTRQSADAAAIIMLAGKTVRTALTLVAERSVDGMISSQVSRLLEGGVGIVRWHKFKVALAVLLVGGLLATAGALAVAAGDDGPACTPGKEAPAPQDGNAGRSADAPAQAQGITLRYKFNQGDEFKYVVEQRTETQTTAPGHDRALVTTQTFDVTWKVTSVDTYGNGRMTLTIDRVRYVSDNGLVGKLEFDSEKHRNPEGLPALARVLSVILKAQVGAKFTCTMSPRGEVNDFKLPKRLADAVKSTQGVQALYSTESLKQQLAFQGSVVLPEDPVCKGTRWKEQTGAAVAGGHAKMTAEIEATYQGDADRAGKKLAEIALKPAATSVKRTPRSDIGPFTLKGQNGKGNIFFDNNKGRLVESVIIHNLDMESSPPGQSEKIVWKVKLSLSAKLVPPN